MTNEKIVTIQRGRGAWQGPESKAPRAPVMCNDAAQLAALGAESNMQKPHSSPSGDMISREAAITLCETLGVLGGEVKNPYACWRTHADNLAAAIRALPAQTAPARKVKALVADLNAIADKRHVGNNKTLTIADADRIADAARILSAFEVTE